MSFYVDSSEQREKARLAERRLLEHEQARSRLINSGRIRPEDEFMLPKSGAYVDLRQPIAQPDYEGHVPSTTPDKYAARFRDGLPPPTPPRLRDQPPKPQRRLIPQHELDARTRRSSPDVNIDLDVPESAPALDVRWTNRFPEADSMTPLVPAEVVPLSPSQKKRLRRKRKREAVRISQNGHRHDDLPSAYPEEPDYPPTQQYCDAQVPIRLPDGSTHLITCPLTPFPHPGQPHLVQLQTIDGATAFVGFWMPGE